MKKKLKEMRFSQELLKKFKKRKMFKKRKYLFHKRYGDISTNLLVKL